MKKEDPIMKTRGYANYRGDDKMCHISYLHDFDDYPCKKCHPGNYWWLKFKAFIRIMFN